MKQEPGAKCQKGRKAGKARTAVTVPGSKPKSMRDLDFQNFELYKRVYVFQGFGMVLKIGNTGFGIFRRFFL